MSAGGLGAAHPDSARPRPIRRVVRCAPADSRTYRYLIEIALSDVHPASPRLAVILKNPSTAGPEKSDPTLGKVEAWARRHGFSTVTVVNLFAWRSAQAAQVDRQPYARAVGPLNDSFICRAVAGADVVVAAWGNPNGIDRARYDRRIAAVLDLLRDQPLHAVGSPTRLGYPRHGLCWNRDGSLLSALRPTP